MKTKRKFSLGTGKQDEEFWKIISRLTTDNIFVQDTNLKYQSVLNPQLGYREQEIIGKTDYELASKADADKLYKIKKQVLDTGTSVEVQIPLASDTGEMEYFSGTYFPRLDRQGHVNGLIGYFKNQTENVKLENEFNLFFDLVPDMVAIASIDGYFKKLNKIWEKVLGFTMDEMQSRPYTNFIHPEDVEPTNREVLKQLQGGSTINFTNRYLCKNGEYKWLDWVAVPSPDGKSLFAAARDITEKKSIEENLKKSENRFSQVAKCSGIWVWEVDSNGLYTYCSDSEESILGYKPEEIVGRKYFYDFFAPDVREELKFGALQAFSRKLPIENLKNPNIHKNGQVVMLETSGIPILDFQGNLTGYRGTDKDITLLTLKEEALRKQANMLEMAHDSIIVRDEDSRISFWNQGAKDCYGWTKDEVLGKVTHTLLKTEFPIPRDVIEKELLQNHYWEGELVHTKKDGSKVTVSSRWQIRKVDHAYEIFEINTDITERKKIEKTLHDSEERFRKAFDTNPDSITVNRLEDGVYVTINRGFQNIFGYDQNEVLGRSSLEIGMWCNPDDRQLFIQKLTMHGTVENFEAKLCTKHKKIIHCLISSTIIDLDGIRHLLTTTKDISEIRLAGEKLWESESKFKKIYEEGPFGMTLVNKDLKFIMANATYCRMLGYSEQELQNLSINDITYTDDFSKESSELHKVINGELSIYRAEKQYMRKDGQIIWVSITVNPNFDEEGQFLYNVAIVEDITQRKLNEQALKNVYERLNLAKDAAGIGIWDWYIPTNELIWDQQVFELYGFLEEKKGVFETWLNGIHPEDRHHQSELIEQALSSNVTFETEFRVLWPDGSVHWLKSSGQVFRNHEGEAIRMVGINYEITDKKSDEEQIKYQNKRLHAIIRTIPDLIFILDKDGKYLEVITSEPEKLLISADKIIGSSINEAFDPDLAKIFLTKIREVLEKGELEVVKYVISLKDSPSTHFEARIAPMEADKVMILSRDITLEEKKAAEINKLSVAVDQSPVSVILTDLEGNIEYANKAFEANTGYTIKEVIGKKISILKSGKTDKEVYRNLWKTIRSGNEWHGEWINKKKNGEFYWETISISPFYDLKGVITNYLAVKLDITDRKNTEELLRENEEKYRYMFVNNPQPMWIYDLETLEFLEVNEAAISHYGFSREEFLHMTLKDIRPKDDIVALLDDIKETRDKLNAAGEWRHLKKNGELMIVEIYSHSITFNGKKSRHVLVNDVTKRKHTELEIRDVNASLEQRIQLRTAELAKANEFLLLEIEERKKAEMEILRARSDAEKANLAKSDFLSRMSHELRTPMNSILGFAQLLEMGTLNPGQEKGINHIMSSGRHLLELINEILDISRIEAGRLALSIEPVQLSNILLEVMDSVQLQANARQLKMILSGFTSNQLSVRSDRQRLKQILLNLVGNAIKYNRDGGSVTISTELLPIGQDDLQHIRISVSDTGYGIAPENIAKLFTPFERIGAEKTQTEGTGLGLAVVKKLIEAMGGRNGVESVVGSGSTFWIELPVMISQSAHKQEISEINLLDLSLTRKSGTILYIEDNEANIVLVREIFTKECPNMKLITANTGTNAVHTTRENLPDLILLDLNLPDMHGSEVLLNLKADDMTRAIPVVIISADAMPSQQKKLLGLGAEKYLTKPLDIVELLKTVDQYIGTIQ